MTAISCTLSLLPLGMTAFATSAETTEETTIEAELEEGYVHAPPSWWNEEQALEMAIEKVKQIQVNGEYVNADWDGEYEYYTLALGTSDKSYNEDSRFSAYFTFYKDEPTFYLESESSNYILCDAYYGIHLMIEDNGSGGMNIYSTTGSKNQPYDYVNSSNKGFRIFEYEDDEETGEKIVSYYHMTYGTYHCYSKSNLEPSIWENLGLKAPDVVEDKNMNVSVQFTPELVGEVDRMRYIESENDYDEMDYFKFKVTNNSKFPVQFQLYIVPKGSEDYDGISGFSNAAFVFMEKEWVYSLDLTNYVNYTNGTVRKQYKYTDWQYLASGETCVRRVNFSQTSIVKNREYTVRVRAVPCEFDCATEAGSSSSGYADSFLEDKGFSSVDEYFSHQKYYDHLKKEIVYSSDFHMASNYDITYDSNDYSNGIAPVGSEYMYESLDKSLSAFLDNQGEQVIQDIGYNSENAPVQFDDSDFDYVAAQNAFSNNANSNNFNFTQQTSGYFSMIQMVLSWFPSWYWGLVSFGLLSVVIIGIIKVIGG